jgi:hypothetical protein
MMLLLLVVPVVVLVASVRRYLQLYAPSNVVVARTRSARPRYRSALLLGVLAMTLLMVMHGLAEAIAAGAPGWLNLVVVVLAWDAIKLALFAVSVVMRRMALSCQK